MRIFWVAWPRTGSTWASQVLAQLIRYGHRQPHHDDWRRADVVLQVHWTVGEFKGHMLEEPRTIVGIRDPRDAIVSHYAMACHENPKFTPENLSILQYIQWYFLGERDDISMPHVSFAQFYREWLDEDVDVWVRHEDLVGQRRPFYDLARSVGARIVGDANAIFKRQDGYKQYVYNDAYLHGTITPQARTPGISTWREWLGEEELALIYESCGDLMHRFGYVQ